MDSANQPGCCQRGSSAGGMNKYIEKRGGKWVILEKGTGKVLSEHATEEKAEESFRAMEWNKHRFGRRR